MQKHLVTVTYGFDAEDDEKARAIAQIIIASLNPQPLCLVDCILCPDSRLHRIHDDKQPEATEL